MSERQAHVAPDAYAHSLQSASSTVSKYADASVRHRGINQFESHVDAGTKMADYL